MVTVTTEIHIWRTRLDAAPWPSSDGLPRDERDRAARMLRPDARRRWVVARWALRGVLSQYLPAEPTAIELRAASRGKPSLTGSDTTLRFNLSHSRDLAVVAVARGLEVGVDVEWIDPRRGRPAGFYAAWTRREAVAKCLDGGHGNLPIGGHRISPLADGRGGEVVLARVEVLPADRAALGPVIDNFIQL